MKRIILNIVLICCSGLLLNGQNSIDILLQNIESNNTQLKALREMSGAEKLENKTANNLANPEVEVSHKPKAHGNLAETEIEATQSFDFPTAYKHRGQTIKLENERVDLAYNVKCREVLLEARQLAVNYIHQKKSLVMLEDRAKYAKDLYHAYEDMFDKGDINILERNKTKLYLLEIEKQLKLARVELSSIKGDLERMNGGEPLSVELDEYNNYQLPLDFESWYLAIRQNNPSLQLADKNIEVSRKQEQLARSLNLPKLRAGYVGDLVRNESRHGFIVGVSIPLWEGKNTVKSKKAQTLAMEYEREDVEYQYKKELRVSYQKATDTREMLKEYKEVVDYTTNFELLKKAFDMGQLNLIEYLQELLIFHEAVDNYLDAEKDYHLTLSELEQWER